MFYQKLNLKRFIEVFKNMQKKLFLTPLGFVRQYNLPKPYCSPSIIKTGKFFLLTKNFEKRATIKSLNRKWALPDKSPRETTNENDE